MKSQKITSIEVAKRAGVSQSAVSRVFTPGASVSSKTVQKVRKVADELGYRPNVLARAARTGKSRIIGFIVAYLHNQFYPESLQKLSERLQGEGYHVLIFTVYNDPIQIHKTIEKMLDYQVDGIIAASVSLDSDLTEKCHAIGVPIVLFNRSDRHQKVSYVTSNNVEGGRKIAAHFLEQGAVRPAYIAGWEGASTQRDREHGFISALNKRDAKIFAREVGDFNFQKAQEAARRLFKAHEKPDAVFVANDHMAFAVMDVMRAEFGLRVPEDVMIAGYDDVEIASWKAYDLTSVRQPANRMINTTVDVLLNAIRNPNAKPHQQQIEGPLMIRSSTRRA